MEVNEAIKMACKEKTLIDALTFIAIWESERAIQQVLEFNRTKVSTSSEDKCWDTCFKVCFQAVISQWQKENESKIMDLSRNLEVTKTLFREIKDAASKWKPAT